MSRLSKVAVITFATSVGDKPFKNYEKEIEKLRGSALRFGLDFHVYTLDDLKETTCKSAFQGYIKFRKGVGGWFWKPLVMLHFLENYSYDYILYLDVDCVLLKNPLQVLDSLADQVDIAGFRMNARIENWTLDRVLNNLSAYEFRDSAMWTAGILVVKNTEIAKDYLNSWLEAMSRPWNLFELPFEPGGAKHRHDQSVLSILIAKGQIQVFNLGEGFYSEGIEATSSSAENAWVATGVNLGKPMPNIQLSFAQVFYRGLRYRVSGFSKGNFWIAFLFTYLWKRICDKFC